jgi:SAM-dependent methyltransferase
MIKWCEENLKPLDDGFEFFHHDVYHSGFNPDSREQALPFPVEDHSFGLVLAWSVFTHLVQDQAIFYLKEVARILADGGTLISTWFTFDKQGFPMMQDHQNALYINIYDPGNAVIYDRAWLKSLVAEAGLGIVKIEPPSIRGFWWLIQMTNSTSGLADVEFPPDLAPTGIERPPDTHKDVSKIGLE